MLTTLTKCIFAVLTCFIILACSGENASEKSYLMIHSFDGKDSQKISDEEKIAQLQKAWQQKRVVKLKRAPSFDYTVSLHSGDKTEAWLVSASGFVRDQDSGGEFYKVDLPDFLATNKKTKGGKQ